MNKTVYARQFDETEQGLNNYGHSDVTCIDRKAPSLNVEEITSGQFKTGYESYDGVNRASYDDNGIRIPIPSGFSPLGEEGTTNIYTGYVIKNQREGSEFVWIPVPQLYSYENLTYNKNYELREMTAVCAVQDKESGIRLGNGTSTIDSTSMTILGDPRTEYLKEPLVHFTIRDRAGNYSYGSDTPLKAGEYLVIPPLFANADRRFE